MTVKIKYLAFKGIEKKEQILFKSFLNLAKNELEYQVVVLKAGHEDEPDILILDESYEFEEAEKELKSRPTILVGNDHNNESETYICRPVQWSDFKLALSQLNVEGANMEVTSAELTTESDTSDRILPNEIKFAINEQTESVIVAASESSSEYAGAEDYEYDLENLTVEGNSFTNSDYEEVVDDVEKFNLEEGDPNVSEPLIMMTDEESSSTSSVLIIETDSLEAWDITLSESTVNELGEFDDGGSVKKESPAVDEDSYDEVVLEKKVGLQLKPNEEYWLSDNEIIVDHQTLFYIKAQRGIIYSAKEPGLWPEIFREGTLSKLPLSSSWQPKLAYKPYPMNCLYWVNALVNDTENLSDDLDEESGYILDTWPQFDLIELDNSLLKLCTMLFVRPETVSSLISKSGYSRATVVGLINACHSNGLLKPAETFEQENSNSVLDGDGVFGKIKGVFK